MQLSRPLTFFNLLRHISSPLLISYEKRNFTVNLYKTPDASMDRKPSHCKSEPRHIVITCVCVHLPTGGKLLRASLWAARDSALSLARALGRDRWVEEKLQYSMRVPVLSQASTHLWSCWQSLYSCLGLMFLSVKVFPTDLCEAAMCSVKKLHFPAPFLAGVGLNSALTTRPRRSLLDISGQVLLFKGRYCPFFLGVSCASCLEYGYDNRIAAKIGRDLSLTSLSLSTSAGNGW